jgi:glycosyltransferase involved in cell wall biosynthesis
MSSPPLVSVIMIFLDAQDFIQEAIESVYAQTYKGWELLLVDDGSTDGSTAIARRYAAQDPDRVRYLEHPNHQNRGMSASRNLGIAKARGTLIALLDSDDVWLPEKLRQQVALLESNPQAAMVYGPTQWWYSWSGKPEDAGRDYIHELGAPPNSLLQPPGLLARFLQLEGLSPCTCSVLLRRAAVEQVGGFEDRFEGLYEDQAFFAKVCLEAPVYVSAMCSARYRQHPNSNCSLTGQNGQYAAARPAFLDWLAAYLTRQGIRDKDVWKALRRERQPYRHSRLHRLAELVPWGWAGSMRRAAAAFRLRSWSLPVLRNLRGLYFRRLTPLAGGQQRGTPVVRYYWDQFLEKHRADIRGVALEIGTTATLRRYGGQAVTSAQAIDLSAHSPEITVVADLSRADHLPADSYDCFVNQFSMHVIYDVEAALHHAIRIMKPGGVLLINFPCVDYYFPAGLDMGTGAPLFLYWWFTPIQVENLLRLAGLEGKDYSLEIFGNLFTRLAYQLNMPAEELTRRELEYNDPGHPLLICARIVKPARWKATKPVYREAWRPEGNPALWNPVTGHYAAEDPR